MSQKSTQSTKSTLSEGHPTVKWWDEFSDTNERMVDIIAYADSIRIVLVDRIS